MRKRKEKTIISNDKKLIITDENTPFSYTEAYKRLRTNVSFITSTTETKRIMVVSSIQDEGKSNVTINLAASLAEAGNRVVIIDCDMRRPCIAQYLELPNTDKCLSSFLSGNDSDIHIVWCEKLGIGVIPAGIVPPNPSELLSGKKMDLLIQELTKRFDYILMDTPPAVTVTDACVLGRVVDAAVLVVRYDYTSKELIRSAVDTLQRMDIKIAGTVLNRYKETSSKSYKSYYYQKGYQY